MAQKKIIQTAGHDKLGEFAPEFAHLNDDILFGEVWSRNDLLSLRDRSLATVVSLVSQGITDSSLTYHLQEAKKNGITRAEISETLTHIAFYCGWPKAWAAFNLAKEVWADDDFSKESFENTVDFPVGAPNVGYAKYFIGDSYLAPLKPKNLGEKDETVMPMSNVTFSPGCRNNWHVHHGARQILICVAGEGWYQEWGYNTPHF